MKNLLKTFVFMTLTGVMLFAASCQKDISKVSAAEPKTDTSTPQDKSSPSATEVQKSIPAEQAPAVPADAPVIKVENPVHDFGNLAPDSISKCQYKFSNTGKGVLKINHIQSTCGCSVPEKLAKMEYNSGESGVIDVTFHAPTHPGLITKHLYIVSNDPANPRAELTIKGTVVVKVTAKPDKLELAVNKENGGMAPITVQSIDSQPFAITGFTATGQIASLDFDANDKKAQHTITPKVDIKKLQEVTSGVIQIKVDHPDTKEINIIFNSLPMYELRPARIILQNTEPGVVTKRDVWVINNFGKEFEIESMSSRNGYMKVVGQKKEGINTCLDVEITPPSQEGTKRRYITDELNIKIKDGTTLTVRCSGWFKIG